MIKLFTDSEFDTAKSDDLLKLKCEHCGKIFNVKKKTIKHELKINGNGCRFCSLKCFHEHNKKDSVIVKCKECDNEFAITNSVYNRSKTKHFFCSCSCSAKYNNRLRVMTQDTKEKISSKLKDFWKDKIKIRKCVVCGREFVKENGKTTEKCCSKECSNELLNNRIKYLTLESRQAMSLNARQVIQKQAEERRSKNEKYFCELCEKKFNNVKHNEPIFNGWDADIIIEDNKYAILWNGIWHYQKVTKKHSLKQVQYRDKIKLKEILESGYTPYVIKDMGKYNKEFVEKEFEKFIKTCCPNIS
jgi:hypothetical protein